MKRYDRYKPTDTPWLGEIPAHWEVKRIRHIIEYSKDGIKIGPFGSSLTGKVNTDLPYKVYGQWNIVGSDFTAGVGSVSSETYSELDAYKVKSGDILISMMGTIGKCALVPKQIQDGIMDSHVVKVRLTSNEMTPRFFEYVYDKDLSNIVITELQVKKKGSIMDGLNSSIIKDLHVPVPPIAEQEGIVRYLDGKCRSIDKVIATQEQRITLLGELKQSIITEAVTRGLNPEATLRPSGIDWLGNIPQHWEVRRFKFCLTEPLMYGANESPDNVLSSDPRYIRITDIDEEGNLKDDTFCTLSYSIAEPYLLEKGDILFARSGATVGKTYLHLSEEQSCFAGYLIKASPRKGLSESEFVYLYTKTSIFDNWKNSINVQATIQNIGADKYANLYLPFPPIEEQREIVSYIKQKIEPIDSAIAKARREIELLREYKQSVITEAVTGKVKVC